MDSMNQPKRFTNEYDASINNSFLRVLKWKLLYKNPQKKEFDNDSFVPCVIESEAPDKGGDKLIWLGHATFLLDLGGLRLLIDPCLTNPPMIKRRTKLPFGIGDIHPDLLLVSHGHYDHFDTHTVRLLGDGIHAALMPTGLSHYAKKLRLNCVEMGWYQSYKYGDVEILFLPAYHWHSRYGIDKNKALWGSFLIRYRGMQIYFCGDSGLNTHFAKIREQYGDMDICIMPVGAYKPRFIMKHSHMDPHESMQAFKDLGGKVFVPMHYGTFILSNEPPSEGICIARAAFASGALGGELRELDIGAVMWLK
jgi:L-ascorbate metabolism protein UlaG (beta-lactamase superfamily)